MVKLAAVLLTLLGCSLARAEGEKFQWNVLFNDWRNIGPFPMQDGGWDADYIGWTGAPDETKPVVCGDLKLNWETIRAGNVYTKERPGNTPAVFYAAARVVSDRKTEAILAFGASQTVTAWHGTEKIFELPSKNRSRMDNYKVKVTLNAGDNWFLFKTQTDNGAQRVLARLLPVDVTKPLLAFRYVGDSVDTRPQEFPDLQVAFLDKLGKTLETHRVSGNISIASELAFYSLYLPKPKKGPASVEVRFADVPDAPNGVARFPWKKAAAEAQDIQITVPQIYRVELPPEFAPEKMEVLQNGKALPIKLQKEGNLLEIECQSAPMVYREFVLVAPGYRAERFETTPRLMDKLVPQPGCTLTGKIARPNGEPIAWAEVRAMLGGKYWDTSVVTGKNGEFELPGLPLNSQIQLLIASPKGDGMFVPVAIGQETTQKLEGMVAAEKAARVRGTVRQPNGNYTYNRIICTGTQGQLQDRVKPDGTYDLVVPPLRYLSVVARGPDLQTQRRLVDMTKAPSLDFDFELKSSPPAFVEFTGADGALVSGLSLGFNPPDGGFLVIWIGLADGRFVLPNPPDFQIPVMAFSNSRAGAMRFTGVVEGPGNYQIGSGSGEMQQPRNRIIFPR